MVSLHGTVCGVQTWEGDWRRSRQGAIAKYSPTDWRVQLLPHYCFLMMTKNRNTSYLSIVTCVMSTVMGHETRQVGRLIWDSFLLWDSEELCLWEKVHFDLVDRRKWTHLLLKAVIIFCKDLLQTLFWSYIIITTNGLTITIELIYIPNNISDWNRSILHNDTVLQKLPVRHGTLFYS